MQDERDEMDKNGLYKTLQANAVAGTDLPTYGRSELAPDTQLPPTTLSPRVIKHKPMTQEGSWLLQKQREYEIIKSEESEAEATNSVAKTYQLRESMQNASYISTENLSYNSYERQKVEQEKKREELSPIKDTLDFIRSLPRDQQKLWEMIPDEWEYSPEKENKNNLQSSTSKQNSRIQSEALSFVSEGNEGQSSINSQNTQPLNFPENTSRKDSEYNSDSLSISSRSRAPGQSIDYYPRQSLPPSKRSYQSYQGDYGQSHQPYQGDYSQSYQSYFSNQDKYKDKYNGLPESSFREIYTILGPLQLLPQYSNLSPQYNSAGSSRSSYAGNHLSLTSLHDFYCPPIVFADPIKSLLRLIEPLGYSSQSIPLSPILFATPAVQTPTPQYVMEHSESRPTTTPLPPKLLARTLVTTPPTIFATPAMETPPQQYAMVTSESRPTTTPLPETIFATPAVQTPTQQYAMNHLESRHTTLPLPEIIFATPAMETPTPKHMTEHSGPKSSHSLCSTLLSSVVSCVVSSVVSSFVSCVVSSVVSSFVSCFLGTRFSKSINSDQKGVEGEKEETASTKPISDLPVLIKDFQAPPSPAPSLQGRFTNQLSPQDRSLASAA